MGAGLTVKPTRTGASAVPVVRTVEQLFNLLHPLRPCLRLGCERAVGLLHQLAVLADGPLPSPFGSRVRSDLQGVWIGAGRCLRHVSLMPPASGARHLARKAKRLSGTGG